MARKQKETLDYTVERQRGMYYELIKCCGKFPRYHKADGLTWVQCQVCENRSQSYLTARLSANKGWNEKRQLQIKIQETPDIKYPRFGEVVHEDNKD